MPGHEVFGKEEQEALNELFRVNGGVTFAHGFDLKRNGVYRVREFETAFATRFGFKFAQAVSSGTAACKVALQALGVGPGDEVITQAFTFVATVEAILDCGASPVILDIDESLNLNVLQLRAAINERTRAVIPVHMMGEMCNMPEIVSIAAESGVSVVEDCAQALGSSLYGIDAGRYGVISTFSTDAGKTLNTGEGGFVATDRTDLFEMSRALHDHGHAYETGVGRGLDQAMCLGFNYRMTELQAAVGIAQLAKLDLIVQSQRQNKARLMDALDGLPVQYRATLDPDGDLADTLVFRWANAETAKSFVRHLTAAEVGTKNLPDALNWHFAGRWSHMALVQDNPGVHSSRWSQSDQILQTSVAIPVGVHLSEDQIDGVRRSAEAVLSTS